MSWQINPRTGDYVMTNGAPIDDPSLIYPAYYRIKIDRSQWLYAPNDQYGSDLYTVKKRFLGNDVSPVVNMVERSLQPMIDDGRASSTDVQFLAPKGRNDIEMSTTIVDAEGNPATLNLPPVGGNI